MFSDFVFVGFSLILDGASCSYAQPKKMMHAGIPKAQFLSFGSIRLVPLGNLFAGCALNLFLF